MMQLIGNLIKPLFLNLSQKDNMKNTLILLIYKIKMHSLVKSN